MSDLKGCISYTALKIKHLLHTAAYTLEPKYVNCGTSEQHIPQKQFTCSSDDLQQEGCSGTRTAGQPQAFSTGKQCSNTTAPSLDTVARSVQLYPTVEMQDLWDPWSENRSLEHPPFAFPSTELSGLWGVHLAALWHRKVLVCSLYRLDSHPSLSSGVCKANQGLLTPSLLHCSKLIISRQNLKMETPMGNRWLQITQAEGNLFAERPGTADFEFLSPVVLLTLSQRVEETGEGPGGKSRLKVA